MPKLKLPQDQCGEVGKCNLKSREKASTEADLWMRQMLELAVRDFKIEIINMLKNLQEKISRMIEHSQEINGNYKV